MTQLFPSVVLGVFTRWFNPWALLVGWSSGMAAGTGMAVALGLKASVYPIHVAGGVYAMYAAVPALALNLTVSAVLTVVFRVSGLEKNTAISGTDLTAAEAYAD
jgi:SSS family solute:Na+ symporter